jgi:hypothetical protein
MRVRKIITQYVVTDYVTSQRGVDDIVRDAECVLTDLGCDGIGVQDSGDIVNVHGWITEDVPE